MKNIIIIGAGAKILPGSIIPNDTDIKAGVIINKDTIFK
jgi:tetrahydrodipicolinate N-succinyltransferase